MASTAKRNAKPSAKATQPSAARLRARAPIRGSAAAKPAKKPAAPPKTTSTKPKAPARIAPFPLRAVLEQLEPRLLMSADVAPLAADALFATPASPGGAEFRSLAEPVSSSAVTADGLAPIQRTHEVVFVDPRVPDRAQLLAGLTAQADDGRSFEVVVLDPTRPGIAQVTEALAQRIQVDAIHFITHGADGGVQLGATWLDAKTLGATADTVASWGNALKADADILFYGCDLAATARGRALIEWIAELTQADVAASTDATGNAAAGGDWELEAKVGAIETAVAIDAQAGEGWAHSLSGTPVGTETTANTTTVDLQEAPAVATSPAGRYVIAWAANNQDGNGMGVFARVYDANGAAQTGEIQANSTTAGNQVAPAVAIDGNGNFVVAWSGGGNADVFFRRFSATGIALGGEVVVNAAIPGNQSTPDIAMETNGDFAIVWQSDESGSVEVWIKRFAADGTTLTGPSLVSISGGNADSAPSIAMDDDGDLVVAWQGQDANNSGVLARRYDNAGAAVGGIVQVNTTSANEQRAPDVAMDAAGNYLVVWEGNGTGDANAIYGQRFTAAGAAQGGEFRVSTQIAPSQTAPSVAMAADGRAVVTWDSDNNQDGSGHGIFKQEYTAAGAADGIESVVNTYTNADQVNPAVAMDDAGNFVVAWSGESAGDTSNGGVTWRRFTAPAGPISGTIYHDVDGDGDLAGASAFTNAIVRLYRDDGDGAIGTGDVVVASMTTGPAGTYSFSGMSAGTYYVVVDSRTLGAANTWAEQTYGAAGSASGAGFTATDGKLFGGRDALVSDVATGANPVGAEHVVKVSNTGGSGTGIDFGFSFNAITSRRDGDDDASIDRSIQGSLRQFIQNANVTAGIQTADFSIGGGGAQSIAIATSMPALTISDAVVLDGATQELYSGTPLIELNGASAGSVTGLTLSGAGGSTVRGLVITRFTGDGILLRSNANLVTANVISSNSGDGVEIDSGRSGNRITGNYIGTNATGTAASPNNAAGINVLGNANTIGGAGGGEGNLISGNGFAGIQISGTQATGNIVQGNLVGTNAAGTAGVPNGIGVFITAGATLNQIGGTGLNAGNTIAFNNLDGVQISGATTTGNAISGNAFRENAQQGIDLVGGAGETPAGVTPNDGAGDPDPGPNGYQNYPQLLAAGISGGNLNVRFNFASTGGRNFRIELFASSAPDANGFGEGQRYLGSAVISTDGGGLGTSTGITIAAAVTAGELVTATATDLSSNNTSEFSNAVVAGDRVISGTIYNDANADATVSIAEGTFAGAQVMLYVDDGDGVIDGGDLVAGSTFTSAAGTYAFAGLGNATYWVVVDSRTLDAGSYLVGGVNDVWAEQTYGTLGAVSFNGSYSYAAGPVAFYGGMEATGTSSSDNATSITTAEHVTRAIVAGANVGGVDAGFSFSAVTSARDGDDDAGNPNRSIQGSLRQFIQNSNALAGLQTVNFEIGSTGSPQTINVTGTALPTITDAVVLDAWTQGTVAYSGPPLIELDGSAAGAGAHGLTVTAGSSMIRGFVINDFGARGIYIQGGGGNTIAGNYIGTDTSGSADRGNGLSGVFIENSAGNVVGGSNAADRNVISGNQLDGISISGAGSTGNLVQGNRVGTNAAGTAALRNELSGVVVSGGGNTIGGTAAGAGNLLSGNRENGLLFSGAGATGNVVLGNVVGLNAAGSAPLANGLSGVMFLNGAGGNTIGGTAAGARNVLSGNGQDGITGFASNNNVIQGNYFGTDAGGTIDRGNAEDGIYFEDSSNNLVGGTAIGAGNVVSGNNWTGITFYGTGSGNVVQGNTIGADTGGTLNVGNTRAGVWIATSGAATVGGAAPGAGNLIAYSGWDGVMLTEGTGHAVLGNTIHSNFEESIDIDDGLLVAYEGIQPNDYDATPSTAPYTHDDDGGVNQHQNFPVLTSAASTGMQISIVGTLRSTENTSFRVEFFANTVNDGEAGRYLGSANIATDATGVALINATFTGTLAAGEFVRATATRADGTFTSFFETSEVGAAVVSTTARSISGMTRYDVNGNGLADDGVAFFTGGTVRLYLDDGDGVIDAGDLLTATTTVQPDGTYTFGGLADATYYVAIDSKTLLFPASAIWAEQTYGVAGAASGAGFLAAAGPLFGGRSAAVSDDASTLTTSEHVTRVVVAGGDRIGIDAGFALNAITSNRDGDDDGAASGRTVQGSLRQFIQNSNAIGGTQTAEFTIGGGGFRSIALASALPVITDAVILDARTQDGFSGTPLIELNGAGVATLNDGLQIAASGVTVRGFIINRFLGDGIHLDGSNSVIAGNWIGLDSTGNAAPGNQSWGIHVLGANNTIGGTGPNDRNVIAGSVLDGIQITGAGATGNLVQGNYIGTDRTGTIGLGNAGDGINITGGAGLNVIGGSAAGARNVIAGNTGDGIEIAGSSSANTVAGNYIGLDQSGTVALGNGEQGVEVTAANNTIGGTAPGAGNRIAFNVEEGVMVTNASTTGVAILGNAIYGNTGIAIDLADDGPTANDPGDTDPGANNLQNFPVLSGAATNGTTVTIAGSLDGPSTNYRIEFFANGVGGPRYLGALSPDLFIGAAGSATFSATLTTPVAVGETITATATNLATSSTSELSAAVTAVAAASISGTLFHDVNGNANLTDDGAGAFFANVTSAVALYLDDGDGVIDSGDSFVAATNTNASGQYTFGGLASGTYYVAVNSRTLGAGAVWAEQTYGVSGAANNAAGTTFTTAPGALYGGRSPSASDNAAGSINTAEHVTKVTLAGSSFGNIDSGFSFNAIVNTRGDNIDDDTSNARMQQGSLRQFILNANAISGTQTANFSITGAGPYVINVSGAALPVITEAVILDAVATQEGAAGVPIIELNGAAVSGSDGLRISGGSSTVRGFAINRFDEAIVLSGGGGNTIAGNYLGTNLGGTAPLANQYGIRVDSSNNLIGGVAAADRNVISGNAVDGIVLSGSDNTVAGNYIGTDRTGTFAIGNGEDGVWLYGGSANTVGGTAPGARNVIAGNGWAGVALSNFGSGHVVLGNWIGLNASGGALGNDENGVRIYDGSGNTIGGTAAGAGNVIAGNGTSGPGWAGVQIDSGSGHAVLGNSIYANSGLGIDAGPAGVTLNDSPDADGVQNFPVLTGAVTTGTQITISGALNSTPGATFRIEFFANAAGDASGYGEGQRFLGSITTSPADASGNVTFTSPAFAAAVALGERITATATDLAFGDTSEFSAHIAATGPAPVLDLDANDSSGATGANYQTTFTENGPAVTIADALDALLTDVDSPTLTGVTVTITNLLNGAAESLTAATSGTSIVANYAGGVLTLTGADTVANYQQVLRTITYSNASDNPNTTPRAITVVATDGTNVSNTAIATVNVVAANDAPAGANNAVATNEDTAYVFTAADFGFSDPDIGDSLSAVRIDTVSLPVGATLFFGGGPVVPGTVYAIAAINAGNLVFTPALNANGAAYASFTFSVRDQALAFDPAPNTMTINVVPANDAPAIDDATAPALNENSPFGTVVYNANEAFTGTDLDRDGQALAYSITGGNTGGAFTIDPATGAITVANPAALDFETTPVFVLTVSATDGTFSDTAQVTVSLVNVNEAPAGSVTITGLLQEDQTVSADTSAIVDPDGLGPLAFQWERSADGGFTWMPLANTQNVALGDADVGAHLRVTVSYTDGGGTPESLTSAVAGPVANVNDAPVVVVAGGAVSYTENDPATAVDAGLTVSDIDNATLASATVRITGGFAAGEDTLTVVPAGGITGAWNGVSGTLTLTGAAPLATWQTVLRSVAYLNTSEDPVAGARTVEFVVNDGTTGSAPVTRTVNVIPVADPPVGTSGVITMTEDTTRSFAAADFGFSDVEGQAFAAVRIDSIALPAGATLELGGVGVNPGDIIATALLSTLVFTPAPDANGASYVSFDFSVQDSAGTLDVVPNTITIDVLPANDVPLAAADAAATSENTAVITGDVLTNDTLGDQPTVVFAYTPVSAQGGSVALNAGNTFTYTPATGFSGTDTFTYIIRDADGETSTATVTVTVANVANDPPVNTVPGAQISAEDTPLVFSLGTGNRISVSDPDAGASPLEVTLTSTNGALTLAGIAGLTFTAGDGTADATMTFTGTATDINAALDGMSFLPTLDYDGPATVTITTGDLGSTGAGGPQSDSDTVNITVVVVDDSPVLDLDADNSSGAPGADYVSTFTEGGLPVRIADVDATLFDNDSANLASLTVTITNLFDGVDEVLTANTAGTSIVATYVPGSGVLTLNGADTVANYQMVLRTVRYENLSDAPSLTQRLITFVASDGGSASNVGTARVTIAAVNDAPVADIAAAAYTATENVLLDLHNTGMSVADVDALASSVVTVQLSSISGFLSAFAGTTGVAIAGSGTPTLTFNGTLTQINSLLAGGGGGWVRYLVGSDSPAPTDTLDLSITDNGATGAGGAQWGWDSVTVNLVAVNDAPIITIPGLASTPEDTPLVFSAGGGNQISITDVDAAGSPVEVTLGVSNGVLTLAGVGGLTFTSGANGTAAMTFTGTVANINAALDGLAFAPTPDYNGPAFLSLSVNDLGASGLGGPLTDADFASITVTGVNDAPAGADATIAMASNSSHTLTPASFGFTDGDAGDTLNAVRIDALPAAGTLTLSGAGVTAGQVIAIADINAGNLVFTPAVGGTGTPYASLSFSVQDSGLVFDASPNTLTFNVAPLVNNPPAGTNGSVTAAPGGSYVFTLADFGYSDPDAGDLMSQVRIDSLPSALLGTLQRGGLPVLLATIVTRAEILAGDLVFQSLLLPGTTAFTFTVYDSNGAFDPAPNTMTVNVAVPSNDPVNVLPAALAANEDTPTALAGISVNDPNGNLQTVQLTVGSGAVTVSLAGGATVAGGANGSATVTLSGSQAELNAALATLSYLGNADFFGLDLLTIRSTDATALVDSDNVQITVNPVNDAPAAATAGAYAAVEQVALALHGTLTISDVDAGGANVTATLSALTGAIFVNPAGATVAVAGSGTPLVTLSGTIAQINAVLGGGGGATVTYLVTSDSPPAADTLTLNVNDGGATGAGGPRSATATATIAIGAQNDAPVNTLPGGSTTLEDTPVVFSAGLGNQISVTDVDAGGAPVEITLNAANGVITLGGTAGLTFTAGDGTADAAMTFTGTLPAVNAALNGLVFTPNLDYNGLAFITLSTNDLGATGAGGALVDSDLATIDVLAVNDAPDGTDATVTLNEDSSHTFNAGDFGFTDVDAGDAMTEVRIDSVSLPAGATLMLGAVPVVAGTVIPVGAIGTLVFTPPADASGAGYASFTFSVRDTGVPPGPQFDATPNTMTINVTPINDLPAITSDGGGATAAFVVAENTAAVTTATAADVDLQPLTFSLAGVDAARFSIDSVTGVLTFNPAPNFEAPGDAGADNVYDVTIVVSDGAGGTDTQALTVTVVDANDAPAAVGEAYVTDEELPLAVAAAGVLGNDGDEDGTPVTAAIVTGPANGSVAFNADGSFVYTPNANFTGVDSFTYQVSDGALLSGAATVTITVNPINDAPTAADGNVVVAAAYAFAAADFNYFDVDGDPLDRIRITALPAEGQLLFNGLAVALNQEVTAADLAAGLLTYAPPTTSTLSAATFGFSVSDGTLYEGASHTMTIGFAVGAVPPPPAPPAPPAPPPVVTPPAEPPPAPAPADAAPAEPTGDAAAGGGRGGGGGGAPAGPPTAESAPTVQAETTQAAAGVVATTALPVAGASSTGSIGFQSGGVAANPGVAAPATPVETRGEALAGEVKAEMETVAAMAAPEVRQALDEVRERAQEDMKIEARVAGSVFVVSTGLSVGYVLWLLRGGALIASLLSSLPAWRLVDPLPVLGSMGGRAGEEDDDSLEDLVADDREAPDAPGADERADNDNVGSVRT